MKFLAQVAALRRYRWPSNITVLYWLLYTCELQTWGYVHLTLHQEDIQGSDISREMHPLLLYTISHVCRANGEYPLLNATIEYIETRLLYNVCFHDMF